MKSGLALLCLALFFLAAPRAPFVGRARIDAATARALVERGTPDLAPDGALPFTVVHRGRRFALAPPVGALALVPAELAALGAARLSPRIDRARLGETLESVTSALLAMAVCLLFFGDLEELGAGRLWAAGATLLLASATALLTSARIPDGAALSALLLLLALRAARRDSPGAALGAGLAAGTLALCDGAYFPAAIALGLFLAIRRRSLAHGLRLLLPVAAAGALAFLYRTYLGAPLAQPGDLLDGLYGLILSTGKSVFLYSPPLLLALFALPWWWRRQRSSAALAIVISLALLFGVAASPRWDGDPAWGPARLFLLVPLLCEPVALWLADLRARERVRGLVRLALLAAAVSGVVVQLAGAAFPPKLYLDVVDEVRVATGAQGWFADPRSECHFIPQFSPITGHLWLLGHLVRRDRDLGRDAPWKLLQENTPKLSAEAARLRLDLRLFAGTRAQGAAWLGLCVALALAGAWQLRARSRVTVERDRSEV